MTAEPQVVPEAADQQQDDLEQQEELIDMNAADHADVVVLAAALGLYKHFST